MIAVVVATFLPTLPPAPTPPPDLVLQRAPAIVEKAPKQETAPTLERMLEGLPVSSDVPMTVKPAFNGGPGAALFVKF